MKIQIQFQLNDVVSNEEFSDEAEAKKFVKNVKRRKGFVSDSLVIAQLDDEVVEEKVSVEDEDVYVTFRTVANFLNVRYQQVYQKMTQQKIRCERRQLGKRVVWTASLKDVNEIWLIRRNQYLSRTRAVLMDEIDAE